MWLFISAVGFVVLVWVIFKYLIDRKSAERKKSDGELPSSVFDLENSVSENELQAFNHQQRRYGQQTSADLRQRFNNNNMIPTIMDNNTLNQLPRPIATIPPPMLESTIHNNNINNDINNNIPKKVIFVNPQNVVNNNHNHNGGIRVGGMNENLIKLHPPPLQQQQQQQHQQQWRPQAPPPPLIQQQPPPPQQQLKLQSRPPLPHLQKSPQRVVKDVGLRGSSAVTAPVPVPNPNLIQDGAGVGRSWPILDGLADGGPTNGIIDINVGPVDISKAGGKKNNNDNNNNNNIIEKSPQTLLRDSGLPLVSMDDLQMDYVLGGGAFGQVWRGTWRGTPVAVKVLGANNNSQQNIIPPSELLAFEEEMKILSRLRHPNICLFMAVCLEEPTRAIVTEVVSRGSVWDVLRDKNVFRDHKMQIQQQQQGTLAHWPWWSIKRILDGTLRGLVYLHSNKPPIIHRDLKSANLLLDDSFNVKLCDFGLARLRSINMVMTAKVGTVQWMAPEVLEGIAYDESADIYSTAIIAWELLTGLCPFDGQNQVDVALQVTQKHARPKLPSCIQPPNGNRAMQEFLISCWNNQPNQRPTAIQALKELETAIIIR